MIVTEYMNLGALDDFLRVSSRLESWVGKYRCHRFSWLFSWGLGLPELQLGRLARCSQYSPGFSPHPYPQHHEGELVAAQLMGLLPGLASAMKYLSEMGYVHRGLAARRVLVSSGLLCKISGFGRGPRDRAEAVYTTMVRSPLFAPTCCFSPFSLLPCLVSSLC